MDSAGSSGFIVSLGTYDIHQEESMGQHKKTERRKELDRRRKRREKRKKLQAKGLLPSSD